MPVNWILVISVMATISHLLGIGNIPGECLSAFFWAAAIPAAIGAAGQIAGMLEDSPEYKAQSFRDINLQNENPDLYAETLKMRMAADEAERMYTARRSGATQAEQRELGQGLARSQEILANQGLLGSSVGTSQMADTESRLRGAIAERALREQQALYQQAQAARGNVFNAMRGMQGDVMNERNRAAQINYGDQQGESQAQNQFFSGLFNSGANLAGQAYLGDQMNAYRQGVPSMQMGAPQYYQPMSPYGVNT